MVRGSTSAEQYAADLASWSETTQRGVRATEEFLDELDLDKSLSLAKENGHQEGNLNAGRAVRAEEINLHHPFWNETNRDEEEGLWWNSGNIEHFSPLTTTFDVNVLVKSTGDWMVSKEETDFVERGDRPLYKVGQIVETAIKDKKTIIPILVSVKDQETLHKIGDIMEEIINKLNKGKRYSVSNCTSLRIPVVALNIICELYTVYQYFAGIYPIYTLGGEAKSTPPAKSTSPPAKKELPPSKLLLARVETRSVYCYRI